MKNILIVDTFAGFGHRDLNNNYIRFFRIKNCNVNFISSKEYLKTLDLNEREKILELPSRLFGNSKNRLLIKINEYRKLRYIAKSIDYAKYDLILFTYFDEAVLFFSKIPDNSVLMNHTNAKGLENAIKKKFLKKCSKKAKILVFHESIKEKFNQHGIENVVVEGIGLSLPKKTFSKEIKNTQTLIFVPSLSKYGQKTLKELIESEKFNSFIKRKNIRVIIKDDNFKSTDNILVLPFVINNLEYDKIFSEADIILLHYPETFKNRVSALLIECFSNNKHCLLNPINSFLIFRDHFNYEPFYNNIDELIERISEILETKNISKFKELEKLNPSFDYFFNEN